LIKFKLKIPEFSLETGITLREDLVPGSKGKGKVVPVLLTEHHAMKAYWGVEV
jgi:hypothetical protein